MEIGIISDTHGGVADTIRALELLKDADLIIHLGDVLYGYSKRETDLHQTLKEKRNILYIQGNCDSSSDEAQIGEIFEEDRIIDVADKKIFATHGHLYSPVSLKLKAESVGADIVLTGHTHKKHLLCEDGLYFLNPGSVSIPRDGTKSIAKFVDNKLQLIDLRTGFITDMVEL